MRALRIVRLVRFCRDLRMMVLAILRSGSTIFWSIFLLCMVMFMFGIVVTQNVTEYLAQAGTDAKNAELLGQLFGNLFSAEYCLFLTVSGGISWVEVAAPLFDIHWANGLLFCFYIFFTTFVIL